MKKTNVGMIVGIVLAVLFLVGAAVTAGILIPRHIKSEKDSKQSKPIQFVSVTNPIGKLVVKVSIAHPYTKWVVSLDTPITDTISLKDYYVHVVTGTDTYIFDNPLSGHQTIYAAIVTEQYQILAGSEINAPVDIYHTEGTWTNASHGVAVNVTEHPLGSEGANKISGGVGQVAEVEPHPDIGYVQAEHCESGTDHTIRSGVRVKNIVNFNDGTQMVIRNNEEATYTIDGALVTLTRTARTITDMADICAPGATVLAGKALTH